MITYKPIENRTEELKIQIYYSKGGINYATYKTDPRGYYLSVTPVKLEKHDTYTTETYAAFSGVRCFLLETTRKSEKAYKQACALAESKQSDLIAHVLASLGIKDNGKELEKMLGFSLAPRFHSLTKKEVLTMPVQVVTERGLFEYTDLEAAEKHHDLKSLCGAMYGVVNGIDALRFETQSIADALSR